MLPSSLVNGQKHESRRGGRPGATPGGPEAREPEQPRLLDVPSSPSDHFSGTVERVTFHNDENGFSVLRVQARGRRELVTVVGHAASVSPGEFIQAEGSWVNDRVHGVQFSARSLTAVAPTTVDGIEKYLGSGLVKGIGPHFARRLVNAFGASVFDVIDQAPEKLRSVEGIGRVRAQRIVDAWREQKAVREIMVFLHSHGVGTSRAVRIFKTYGQDAMAIISENPYRLAADIRGIGFLTADKIAGTLGIEKTAMIRARAGIGYTLGEAMDEGHCGLPLAELRPAASKLLDIPETLVGEALALELSAGTVVEDTVAGAACVFLAGLHAAERMIAARIRGLASGSIPWKPIDAERAIPWVEARLSMSLAAMQAEALRLAVRSKTIHRLPEVDPRGGAFKRQESHPLACDLLVVDEMSMVDVPLMHALLRAVPPHASVILVGDVDQLPSVGPGQVLSDIIESGAVPVVRLTEVFRQASESRIIVNAHRINRGEMPEVAAANAV